MSRFSEAAAKAAGWSIVHQRDEYEVVVGPGLKQTHPATIVAEKYISLPGHAGRLIHEEAESMGKLLERIHAYEQNLEQRLDTEPAPVDLSTEPRVWSPLFEVQGEEGEVADSVIVPADPGNLDIEAPVRTLTDAEWSARGRADVLVVKNEDGQHEQVAYSGGDEHVMDAEEARTVNKKAIEDRRAAEPAHGPVEQIEYDTADRIDSPGQGAGGTLIVREGEGPEDISDRKEALKKMREEGRVASSTIQGEAVTPEGADKLAGVDVGIQERGDLGSEIPPAGSIERTLEEPENEYEENVAPHLYPEGAPAESGEVEDEQTLGEAEQAARSEAGEEAAKEEREEGLAHAESDEGKEAVLEAEQEAAASVSEDPPEGDQGDNPTLEERVAAGEPGAAEQLADTQLDDGEQDEIDNLEVTDAARAKAEELGVDLNEVKGSGKDGRITVSDVEAASSSE